MKNLFNKKNENHQSGKEIQTVEMIVYFEGKKCEHRTSWASFDMSDINQGTKAYKKMIEKFPESRSDMYEYVELNSLLSKPDLPFYISSMSYMCSDESIQKEVLKYPNGGWAIIGHFNYNDKTDQKFQILNPEEFKKHLNDDYSINPFTGKEPGISLEGDSVICENHKEGLFLSCLVELIKMSGVSCCHLSNNELLRSIPSPLRNKEWISKTIGKFLKLGIIGVMTYDLDGSIWYRDIFMKHPANHILCGLNQSICA